MKKRLLSAVLAMVMMLTMAPIAFAAENTDGWYDELVQSEAYTNYGTPPWDGAAYGDYAYSLLDIDQNGFPELILRAYNQDQLGTAWPWYTVFTYDAAQEQVVFVGDLYPYDDISYSASEKAIACSPTKPNVYGYGMQFYGLTQQKIQSLFYVGCWSDGQENDTYHRSNDLDSGEEEIISKLEYDQYLNGLVDISFTPISEYKPAVKPETPSSWAVEEIEDARGNGLIPEELDEKYQNNVTRQEFCQLAVQLIESSIGRSIDDVLNYHDVLINESEFNDTNDKNVLVMNALHVVSGVGKGKFEPSRAINREEAATMLARLAKVLNASQPNDATLTFGDRSEISEWAYDSIIFVSRVTNKNGLAIMGGTGDNKFAPKDTYTREQAFLSFGRLFDVVQECTIGSMVVEKPIEAYAGPGDQYRKFDSIYESAIDEYIYEQTGWLEVESEHRRVYVRKSDLSEPQISDIPLVVKRVPYGPTPRPNIVFLSGVNRILTCGVDIHSGPDFSYSVMSTLDPGTKLTILYQLPQKSITDINPFLLVEYETSDGLQRGYADKNTVMDIYNPLNGFDMVKQSNASFDYLGDTYYSTIASTTALDGWSTKYSTTITDIQFDFMAAVTGAIDSNDNNIDLVGETWMYDAKLNANIPVNTQNNGNAQNKVNGALDLIGMFNAALSSGNKSMAIQVDMQTYKNEGRIILRSGAPFETAHAGDQVLLSALIAQNGSALSLVERNKRADQLIRAICPEITGSGLWDMQITFSDDYSIDPYGYYYVFDKDANVYAHLILHPGTRFLVFQEEKERIDITGRIAGIQLQVDGEVRDRILQMLNENGIHLNT